MTFGGIRCPILNVTDEENEEVHQLEKNNKQKHLLSFWFNLLKIISYLRNMRKLRTVYRAGVGSPAPLSKKKLWRP